MAITQAQADANKARMAQQALVTRAKRDSVGLSSPTPQKPVVSTPTPPPVEPPKPTVPSPTSTPASTPIASPATTSSSGGVTQEQADANKARMAQQATAIREKRDATAAPAEAPASVATTSGGIDPTKPKTAAVKKTDTPAQADVFGKDAIAREQQAPGYFEQRNATYASEVQADPSLTDDNIDKLVRDKLLAKGINNFQTNKTDVDNTVKLISDQIRAQREQTKVAQALSATPLTDLASTASSDDLSTLSSTDPDKYAAVMKLKSDMTSADRANQSVTGDYEPPEPPTPPSYEDMAKEAGIGTSSYDLSAEYKRIFDNESLKKSQTALTDLDSTLSALNEEKYNLKDSLIKRFEGTGITQSSLNAVYYDEAEGIDKQIRTASIQRDALAAKYDSAMKAAEGEYKAIQDSAKAEEDADWKLFEAKYGMAKDVYNKQWSEYEKKLDNIQKDKEKSLDRVYQEASKMEERDYQTKKTEAGRAREDVKLEGQRAYDKEKIAADREYQDAVKENTRKASLEDKITMMSYDIDKQLKISESKYNLDQKYGKNLQTIKMDDGTLTFFDKGTMKVVGAFDPETGYTASEASVKTDGSDDSVRNALNEFVKSNLGAPYVLGGQSSKGYDCSGLIVAGLQAMGVVDKNFDTTAQGLYNASKKDVKPLDQLVPGNLVYFKNTKAEGKYATGDISHVEVFQGYDDKGNIITAGANTGSNSVSQRTLSGSNKGSWAGYQLIGSGVPYTSKAPSSTATPTTQTSKTPSPSGIDVATASKTDYEKKAKIGKLTPDDIATAIVNNKLTGNPLKAASFSKYVGQEAEIGDALFKKQLKPGSEERDIATALEKTLGALRPKGQYVAGLGEEGGYDLFSSIPQVKAVVGDDQKVANAYANFYMAKGSLDKDEDVSNKQITNYLKRLRDSGLNFDAKAIFDQPSQVGMTKGAWLGMADSRADKISKLMNK